MAGEGEASLPEEHQLEREQEWLLEEVHWGQGARVGDQRHGLLVVQEGRLLFLLDC
jgi:hypothetical protein